MTSGGGWYSAFDLDCPVKPDNDLEGRAGRTMTSKGGQVGQNINPMDGGKRWKRNRLKGEVNKRSESVVITQRT